MKLKFKLKGLMVEVKELPHGLIVTIEAINQRPPECQKVPPLLQRRIQACQTLTELLQLLFATTEKNEAVMTLFDQKMEALEREGFSIIKPLNKNNHGSTSS